MRTLYVAAGGGGDAVGALLARRALGDTDERPPLVTTCAWERLRIDPVPGPRARADFTGLGLVGGEPCEVLPDTDTVPLGRSVLPRLAETSGARIFLHDFEGGAVGLADQLQRLSASFGIDSLVVVDVGGDVVARGSEPTLKSPLADSLTLAAALATGIPTTLVVLGPGSDAELPEAEVVRLLEAVGGKSIGRVSSRDVAGLDAILAWHPTEATTLVAAGAEGMRGMVAMRRGWDPVPVTDSTPQVWSVPHPVYESFPLTRLLQASSCLSEAEEAMRDAATDEIDFERTVAMSAKSQRAWMGVPDVLSNMTAAGATHITSRRLLESLPPAIGERTVRERGPSRRQIWSKQELARIADLTNADS